MQFKSALVAALTATAAFAASNSTVSVPSQCSVGTSATATSQADLDKLSGCQILVGNLTISGDLGNAALANVKKIDGSLTIKNATNLANFAADSVQEITGALELRELTILSSASLGSLKQVDSITFITLPALTTFNSPLESANNIYISDTTLESVEGFASLKSVRILDINNNRYLNSFDSSLETVSDSLSLSSNSDEVTVSFDNLIWANNITLRDVNAASFDSLQAVNSSLGFINNTIPSLKLNKLKTVGQTLSIVSNNNLTIADFNNLTTIGGGFVVANNTKLADIKGFKEVATVGGAIEITGNFSSLDLEALKSVRGGAKFETSSGNFSCSALQSLQRKGAIQGDSFVCKNGARSTSISLTASSTRSSSDRSSSSERTSATSSGSSKSEDSSSTASVSSSKTKKSKGGAVAPRVAGSSFLGGVAAIALALI